MIRKLLVALAALLAGWLLPTRPAQADLIYFTVDNQINTGYMLITGGTGSFSNNQWSITITATDTSPTVSYSDVGLTLQYIFPADNSGDPNAAGLAYDSATETWSNGSQTLLYTAVSPGPLGQVPISETNAPQTWASQTGGFPASLQSTDVVPFFNVGDFGPLQSKNFTLTADVLAGGEFPFQTVGFFVVPETRRRRALGQRGASAALVWLAAISSPAESVSWARPRFSRFPGSLGSSCFHSRRPLDKYAKTSTITGVSLARLGEPP